MTLIPVMRVNYSILQLVKALFVFNTSTKYRDKLKRRIAHYFNVKSVLLTSSCRTAVYKLLMSLHQSKVIVPAYTCGVVVEAAMLAKKTILYANVDRNTLNVSQYPEIDSDTIVIATHQYGFPCEISKLSELCKQKGAILIEDCAGSLGTTIDGKLTGTFGDFGVFSFSASKTIHSPTKGGFIICQKPSTISDVPLLHGDFKFKVKHILKGICFCLNNNPLMCAIFQKLRKIDNDPANKERKYLREETYVQNFHEWQAYVVLSQYKKLDSVISQRQSMAMRYDVELDTLCIRKIPYCETAVNIRYPILVEDRQRFVEYALSNGVQVGTGYDIVYCPQEFHEEQEIIRNIVYLPLGSRYSNREIDKIIRVVNNYR